MKYILTLFFLLFFTNNAFSLSWQINCVQKMCNASAYHMSVSWVEQNSTLSGKLVKIEGIPISNAEFNFTIQKLNHSGLNLPQTDYSLRFIKWLGDIGYSNYKHNINRYLAAASQTVKIYSQNQIDEYILAFLAFNFPRDFSKINFNFTNSSILEKAMFIKYLSFFDKTPNVLDRMQNASKAYIYLLQDQNKKQLQEYLYNFRNYLINYKANQYYMVLASNMKEQFQEQYQRALFTKIIKTAILVCGLLIFLWIAIFGIIIVKKKRGKYA